MKINKQNAIKIWAEFMHGQCTSIVMAYTAVLYKFSSLVLMCYMLCVKGHISHWFFFCFIRKHSKPNQCNCVCACFVYSMNLYSNFIGMNYIVAVAIAIAINFLIQSYKYINTKYMIMIKQINKTSSINSGNDFKNKHTNIESVMSVVRVIWFWTTWNDEKKNFNC